MRIALALLCILLPGQILAQEDWPQFRGADGRAVARGSPLPATFDPQSPALQWKVPVRGSGNSSPIVSRGQVFVTTAYEGEGLSRARSYTHLAMLALGVLALLAIARRMRGPGAGTTSVLARIDRVLVVLATLAFGGIAAVAAIAPQTFWAPGVPGDTWLVTGTAGLTGLFAAFGWLGPRSPGRWLAVVLLLCAALYLYVGLPLNKHHAVYALHYRLMLIAPGVFGAAWYLLLLLILPATRDLAGAGAAGAIAGTALLLFVSCNFVNPAAGLVRAIVALDLHTGKQQWDTPLFVAPEERLHRQNSFATPTPCVSSDGDRVLAFFGPGWACVDRKGARLWEGRDDHYMAQSHYGAVSSPIPFGDTFLLLHDTERTAQKCSYVLALDQGSGQERWRINPDYAHESYMTPLLMRVGKSTQLITVTFGRVVAYDPQTGDRKWELPLPTWQHVPSLTHEGDVLFVAGGAHTKWVTAAVRVKETGAEVIWQTRRMVPHTASPVYLDGMLFTVTTDGMLVCYDAMSGKRHWNRRLNGRYMSSLVAGGGKVLACSEEGDVVVVAARPEYRELSRANLGEHIRTTPAIAQGRVLIRTARHLYCFLAAPQK